MTKTYIKPETLVHQVKIESLLGPGSPNNPPVTNTDADKDGNGDYPDAKGFSFFFEEEIDEE